MKLKSMPPVGLREVAVDPTQIEAIRSDWRQKCRDSLWFFAFHACGYKNPTYKFDIDNDLHRHLCMVWQDRIHFNQTMWQVPRGHMKTSLWTVAGTLWELINNKDLRFLVCSAKEGNSKDIIRDIRAIIDRSEMFRWLFPEFCHDLASEEDRARCVITSMRIDVPCSMWAGRKEGSIMVGSTEADITSKHFDRLVYDDIVNENNSGSKEMLDKVDRWFANQTPLRDGPESIVRVIGTRWDYGDVYGRIYQREMARRERQKIDGNNVVPGWLFFRLGVWHRDRDGNYKLDANGERIPIWPEKYSNEAIADIRDQMSPYLFACQYLNEPVPAEDATFKIDNIQPIDNLYIPEGVINFMAVDLADDETSRGDYCVVTCASFDDQGRMYIREIYRTREMSVLRLAEQINRMCIQWKPQRVGVETVGFQRAILRHYKTEAAKHGWNIPWTEIRRGNASKFKRILGVQPRVERGDFFVDASIPCYDSLVDEMARFPKGSHDDILDTLADLEHLYYNAPREIIEPPAKPGTFQAIFQSLLADQDTSDANPNLSWRRA